MKKIQLYYLFVSAVILLILIQNPIAAVAQVAKLANEATFLQDVKIALSKSASRRANETMSKFEATWTKLNAEQRKQIYEISHHISTKTLDPLVQLENFYGCITALADVRKLPADEVSKFINVAGQTAERYNYSVHILSRFFTTSRSFLEENFLYKSTFYDLRASKNTKFSFEFVNAATELLKADIREAAADTVGIVEVPTSESDTSGFSSAGDTFESILEETPIRDTIDYSRPVFEKPIVTPVSGPIIKFETVDLEMLSHYDTLTIKGTTGKVELAAYKFHGTGGRADWSGEGMSASDLFCELDNFEMDTRKPELTAKYAKLTYKSKTDGTVLGDFEYKSERRAKKEYSRYPKFTSYYADAIVKNLAKEVTYKGGCSLVGKRFTSKNLSNAPSKITINKGGKKKFEASSKQEFIFSDSLITNPLTQVRIFMQGSDSLYIDHVGAELRYSLSTGFLRARKERHEYRYTPFFDSYHRMEIFADYVEWNVTKDSMTIAMLTGNIPDTAKVSIAEDPNKKAKLKGLNAVDEEEMKKMQEKEANKSDKEKQKDAEKAKKEADKAKEKVGFNPDVMEVSGRPQSDYSLSKNPKAKAKGMKEEGVKNYTEDISADKIRAEVRSMDYFNENEYVKLKGLNDFHPLAAALAYTKQVKSTKFSMEGMAKFIKRKPEHVRGAMKSLQRLGYINLDAVSAFSDSARLTRKGVLYANAFNSAVDYDKLEMFSISEGAHSNMKLDLNSNDLIVNDVPLFPLRRHPDHTESDEADSLPKDRLDVWAKPKSKRVVIKQNRKIVFDGEIDAIAQAKYRAKGFEFNYDTFQIAMKEADIAFIEKDSSNRAVRDSTGNYKEMANKIKGTNGVLRLAYPKNKSSELPRFLQKSYQYPYFSAEPGAYIGFDGKEILDGSYNQQDSASGRNKVRIDLEKFRMDSLSMRNVEKTVLDGMFRSNGIFPDFRIVARIMPDKGFGFMNDFKAHKDSIDASPPRQFPDGYPLYTDALGTKKANTAIFTDHDATELWTYDIHERDGKHLTDQWNIMMDNSGIRGNGKINYLSAQLSSNDYVFFPDSATALGKMKKDKKMIFKQDVDKSKAERAKIALEKPISWGVIEANPDLNGTSYPDVKMTNFQMNWAVKADSMRLSTTKRIAAQIKNQKSKKDSVLAFEIYGKPAAYKHTPDDNSLVSSFVGTMVLNPKQLAGDGVIQNKGVDIKSDNFAFQMSRYHADNASYFKIKSDDPKKPALFAKNVKVDYDLEDRFSKVVTNNPQALNFAFPYISYATSLGEARWAFDSKKIIMNVAAGTDASTSIFRSTNLIDSLNLSFNGNFARYELSDHTLHIGGVPFIRSVDAEIEPDSGLVTVKQGADMEILRNCRIRIMLNGDTAHRLYEANIKIKNSQDYEGTGTYYYTNDVQQTYKIKFNSFSFDKADATVPTDHIFTYAEADIDKKENFEKQGGKYFYGKVKMYATRKDLVFEGWTRDADDPNGEWVATNPGEAVMTFTGKEVSDDKQILATGIFLSLSKDNEKGLYSLVNKQLEGKNDKAIFQPELNSIIKQDPKSKKMVIATETRMGISGEKSEESYIGNKFAYSNASKEVDFEGNMKMFDYDGKKNNKNFTVQTSCIGKGNMEKNTYDMNTMLTIDLGDLAGDAFREMASDISKQSDAEESPIKIDDDMLYKIAAQVSPEEMKSYYKKVQKDNSELSKVLDKKALVISEVTMKWNEVHKAFYSTGKIQLANVYNKNLNQLIKGYIEIPTTSIEEDKSKATLNIYLEISKNRWYYFSYRNGKLHLLSSNDKFNEIADPKQKKSKDDYELMGKSDKSQKPSNAPKIGFISRFLRTYFPGQEAPIEDEEDETETIEKEKDDDGDGKK